jgi:hypothetical protein
VATAWAVMSDTQACCSGGRFRASPRRLANAASTSAAVGIESKNDSIWAINQGSPTATARAIAAKLTRKTTPTASVRGIRRPSRSTIGSSR